MAKMLLRDLTPDKQAALANLMLQPGWQLVEQMFEQFCTAATAEMLQLKATEERYLEKLQALQVRANLANDVCGSVLRSIQEHAQAYLKERELEDATQVIASKVRTTLTNPIGR